MAKITIFGLCHGKPEMAEFDPELSNRDTDLRRPLSVDGKLQARDLSPLLLPMFSSDSAKQVLCSPAERVLETVEHASGITRDHYVIVEELYTPQNGDGEIMDKLREQLGNEPLSTYFRQHVNLELFGKESPISRISRRAGEKVASILLRENDQLIEQTFLIAGHAVLLQLAVEGTVKIIVGENSDIFSFLDSISMGDGGLFRIMFDTENPNHVETVHLA